MSELKEEELLEYLYLANKSFIRGIFGNQEQAYQQIAQIIKLHFHPKANETRYPFTEREEEWIRIK